MCVSCIFQPKKPSIPRFSNPQWGSNPPPKFHRLQGTGVRLWAFCRVVRYLWGPHRLSALVGKRRAGWGGYLLYVMSIFERNMTLGTLLNNKQMSRMVEVEHKPALDFESVFHFSKRGDCQLLMCFFFFPGVYLMDPYGILGAWFNGTWDVKLQ